MFYYLNGTVALMDAGLVVLDVGGVGFSVQTTSWSQGQMKTGAQCKLYTHCNIREDAFDIFGFTTREELRCFQQLVSVTGVGPKAALAILSTATPKGLTMAVLTGDEKSLTMAPGVGKKLAQRILLELKDKMGAVQEIDFSDGGGSTIPAALSEDAGVQAAQALGALGYSQNEIAAALKNVDKTLSVEDMIRQALRQMVRG